MPVSASIIMEMALIAATFTATLYMARQLIGYLNSKPPGMQSPMDEVNKIVLSCYVFSSFSISVTVIVTLIEIDIGHVLASLISHTRFSSACLLPFSFAANAMMQHVLIHYYWIVEECALSDQSLALLIMGFILVLVAGELTVFALMGATPTAYHPLRFWNKEVESAVTHTNTQKTFIAVNWTMTFFIIVMVRQISRRRWRRSNPITLQSNHLIKAKVLIYNVAYWALVFGIHRIFWHSIDDVTYARVINYTMLSFPSLVIYFNPQSHQFLSRRFYEIPGVSQIMACFHAMKIWRRENAVMPDYECNV